MSDDSPPPPRRRYQFSLGSLFVAMLACSVLSAILAGLLYPERSGFSLPRGSFVLMAVAAPMAVMIVLSLFQALVRLFNRRR